MIEPELSLIENDNEKHAFYLRGRARLLRRMQLSGEVGWEYAPERGFPRPGRVLRHDRRRRCGDMGY